TVLSVAVPALQLGVPMATTLDTGEVRLFQVTVPQGDTVRVDLTATNSSAANELFLRYNALPTASVYDAAYQGALQANQFAVIPSTTAGIYYVMVNGQSEPGAQTPVTLVANVLPFEISDVIPDEGGDSKYVTTTILGAQFDPQAIVKLVRPGIAEFEPVSYQVIDKTKIIAIFDLTKAPHGQYDVEVINPDGSVALAPYRYLVEQALPPDVNIALGGPRVVWAGQSGLYGFSLSSTTNVDIPYVEIQYGIPNIGVNTTDGPNSPYLALTTNLQGSPSVTNVPWDSVNPIVNTSGEVLATGYAMDFADQSNTALSFLVQTYPNGLGGASGNPPAQTAFAFNIVGAATPLTTAEFIAQQTQLAATLRTNILADPTASSALQTLAADATNWTDLYLEALTQAGLLRPVDVPPQVSQNPVLFSLQTALAAGILAGPAGKQIITSGNLVGFFNQVQQWYGSTPNQLSKYIGTGTDSTTPDEGGTYLQANPPPASDFNLNESQPTHYEGFYVYVPYTNDYDAADEDPPEPDTTNPQNANFINVSAPNFAPFFTGTGRSGQASINGPLGFGAQQFVPLGQPLPYTIQFQNAPAASSTVGQVRIVSRLDPNLDPRTLRLGDIKLGDVTVHVPSGVGSFQEDIDLTSSKGFILRVSGGIDINSDTMTWLLQAIDPLTGEVITDPGKGLLPPDNASGAGEGFVSYTVKPLAGLTTGTQVSSQARVLFNTAAPLDTPAITYTIDATAPTTTLTATPLVQSGSDYNVQWNAVDDPAGSGVKSTTVYVAEDGGDYAIWLDQTTATSGIYNGESGHTYQFLAISIDNAGNEEMPPSGTQVPSSNAQVNLGGLPTVPGTTTDLGAPQQPSTQPSTNPLFTQAQQGIPAPTPTSHAPEFTSVIEPFSGQAFATGIGQSQPSIGPVALLSLPDGSLLVSGGPARNQLFEFGAAGGQAGTPVATFAEPIYDMALDAAGNIWATTGGGPLYELDPQTFAILGQFGDSLTQSLAIQPGTGLIYVSSGNGIEVFNPVTHAFGHFSDIRVGSLAFDNQGTLWAATWPHNQTQIIQFTGTPLAPKLKLQLASDVDAIAFGQPGTKLANLLFVSHTDAASPGAGSELTMIDVATLQQVALASGGTRGDEIKTSADGRVFISQSHQVDVLNPIQPPHVAGTNPPPQGIVSLPLGSVSVTFDEDMLVGDPTDPHAVVNPANYQLTGDNSGAVTITSVSYDAATRTALLEFNNPNADHYTLKVLTGVEN
ncbi:MAG TPA: pre-peptidase C-terminal domain-containing protein, partial [Gemmataceae bacterium]|nr:pre-peptidase C-terminal domain-containing protein [Gemmataceae bacterium]